MVLIIQHRRFITQNGGAAELKSISTLWKDVAALWKDVVALWKDVSFKEGCQL